MRGLNCGGRIGLDSLRLYFYLFTFMRQNKFYLLVSPVLLVVLFPFFLAWHGLRSIGPLLYDLKDFPRCLRRAWKQGYWFRR